MRGGGSLSALIGGGSLSVLKGGGSLSALRGGGCLSVLRGGGSLSVLRGGGSLSVLRGGGSLLGRKMTVEFHRLYNLSEILHYSTITLDTFELWFNNDREPQNLWNYNNSVKIISSRLSGIWNCMFLLAEEFGNFVFNFLSTS